MTGYLLIDYPRADDAATIPAGSKNIGEARPFDDGEARLH